MEPLTDGVVVETVFGNRLGSIRSGDERVVAVLYAIDHQVLAFERGDIDISPAGRDSHHFVSFAGQFELRRARIHPRNFLDISEAESRLLARDDEIAVDVV